MKTIPIKDKTFHDMPEIRKYMPCAVEIKTVKVTETGERFNVAKVTAIVNNKAKYIALYPEGNDFARQCCVKLFKPFFQNCFLA
jgi:hypothetical protein